MEEAVQRLSPPDEPNDDINSNVHFRNAHLKCAEVYAQFPQMQLKPREPLLGIKDPATGQPFMGPNNQPMDPQQLATHLVAVKRELLTEVLGPDGADADMMAMESLFDIFATSGVAFTKICYEADTQPTPMTVPGPTHDDAWSRARASGSAITATADGASRRE